jgi:heat shock protein HtpX
VVSLLQLALSRAREYDADLDAAGLTGDPRGLASALARLERRQGRYWEEILLPGRRMPDPSLLRTHPPTAERIRRLLALLEPAEPAAAMPSAVTIPIRRPAPAAPRWHWPGVWY